MFLRNNFKEAVNLLVLTRNGQTSEECDYSVLTVRGNANNNLQVRSWVSPGGTLDSSDFSAKWWQLFEKFDLNSDFLDKSVSHVSHRPPIIADNILFSELRRSSCDEQDFVSTDIALRISAIRHLFVQTGILLAKPMDRSPNDSSVWEEWRQKISQKSEDFFKMCDQLNLRPDLFALKEWWNWLTPSSVGRNTRLDTIYYICFVDNSVVSECQHWSSPKELIDNKPIDGYFLSPPQIYEFSRLLHFNRFQDVITFAEERQQYGIDRWMPVLSLYCDGSIAALPGDDIYPDNVELVATKPVRAYPQSLDQMRRKAVHLNRLELRGTDSIVLVNIDMPYGHISPLSSPYECALRTAYL